MNKNERCIKIDSKIWQLFNGIGISTNMIRENYLKIKELISKSCKVAGRESSEIIIVAVSKLQPVEKILSALELGILDFGENYVNEWRQKKIELKNKNIKWHFIGKIQTNKIKYLVNEVYLIHSIDNIKQLEEIDKRAMSCQNFLIQVNLAKEKSKSGVLLEDMPLLIERAQRLNNVRLQGLMFMPPIAHSPEENRSYFAQAKKIIEQLKRDVSDPHELKHLSMGTSQDYLTAIEEGATIVRIGQNLMGQRGQTISGHL